MPEQAEAERDGVIDPQNYNFNQFKILNICMLSKRFQSIEVDRRTSLEDSSPPAVTLNK